MRQSLILLLIILLSLATTDLTSIYRRNYVASSYYSISVLRNLNGLYDWRADFIRYYKNHYDKVQLRSFNQLVLKLKDDVQKKKFYLKHSGNKKNHSYMFIPVIFLKEEKSIYNKLQIYYNGSIFRPQKIDNIGDITVQLKRKSPDSKKILSSYQTYSIYVYTFSDIIYNKSVILSIKDRFDIAGKFNIGKGLLPKKLLD